MAASREVPAWKSEMEAPPRDARAVSPRARRLTIIAAGTIAMALGTVPAVRQLPAPTPVPTWRTGSLNWWRYPVERNAAQRMYVTPGPLSAVFAVRGTEDVWFAGDGGLLIHSTDGGRSWRDTNLKALYLPAYEPLTSIAPRTSRVQRAKASLFLPASFIRSRQEVPGKSAQQQQQVPSVRVPVVIGQTLSIAFATLSRAGLRIRLIGGDSSGRVISQAPAPASLVSVGSYVTVTVDGNGSIKSDSSGFTNRGVSAARDLPVRKAAPGSPSPQSKAPAVVKATPKAKPPISVPIPTDTAQFYPRFSAICFASARVGWVAGDHGAIFSTTDGGATWQQQFGPRQYVTAIACDSTIGAIAVGDGESVLLTPNGRVRVHSNQAPMFDVAIGAGGVVWASQAIGQQTRVVSSVDGGASWTHDSTYPSRYGAVAFADSLDGMLAGEKGFGVRTSPDGGRSWSTARCGALTQSDSQNHLVSISAASALSAVGIDYMHRVWTTSNGWVWCEAGTRFHSRTARLSASSPAQWYAADSGALQSFDGGRSWQTLINRSRFTSITFADSLHGWAGMENGEVARTSSAGRTWSYSRLDDLLQLPVVHIAHRSGSDLFATDGTRGYASTDRGATWRRVPGADSAVVALFFKGDTLAWGLRADTIVASRDAGRTWSRADTSDGAYRGLRAMPGGVRTIGISADTGSAGGAMWATDPEHRLLRYTGTAWDTIRTTPLLAAIPVKGRLAYGLDAGGELVRSTDDGRSWAPAAVDPPHKYPAPWYYAYLLLCVGGTIAASRVGANNIRRKPPASIADILVPDRPLREGDRDVLAFGRIAGGLSRFIQNARTEPPLTIAITGEWGTGKSSLMNLLQRDLELRKYRTIWFNAWHHQREESLLASLLESIRRTATPPMWTWRGVRFRGRLLWSRIAHYAGPMVAVIPAFTFAIGYILADPAQRWGELVNGTRSLGHYLISLIDTTHGTVAGTSAASGSPVAPPLGAAPGTLLAAIVSVVGTLITLTKGLKAFGVKPDELARSAVSAGQVKTIAVPPAFRYLFARDFREVTEALKPERLVIFVDDLDRCKPDQVLEILEAINFLTESGDCVVVLGIDRERVTGCVAIGFREVASMLTRMHGDIPTIAGRAEDSADAANVQHQIDYARHYLEKLLNMEVAIPETTAVGLGRVMTKGSTAATPLAREEVLAERARKLKQLKRNMIGATMGILTLITFYAGLVTTSARQKFGSAPLNEVPPAVGSPGPVITNSQTQPATNPSARVSFSEIAKQQSPVSLTHGALPTTASWLFVMVAIMAAGSLVWLVTPTYHGRVDDSADFTDALLAWAPVLFESLHTPRAAKKFLNRVRFLAMSQRVHAAPRSPLERLREWFARLRGDDADQAQTSHVDPELQPDAIPEVMLVSLSVIAEQNPDWLAGDDFWKSDLRAFVSEYFRLRREQIPDSFLKAFAALDAIAARKDELARRRGIETYKNAWRRFANWSSA